MCSLSVTQFLGVDGPSYDTDGILGPLSSQPLQVYFTLKVK